MSAEKWSTEWFEPLGENVEQGDLLFDFDLPAITYDAVDSKLGLAKKPQSVIVITQTCDIPKPSQTEVVLASVFEYPDLVASNPALRGSDARKALSQGLQLAEFALPPRLGQNDGEFLIVSFRKLHVVPKAYLLDNLGTANLRLKSPYKEYFAQAYARFMMRVGLPLPLPSKLSI